MAIDVGTVLGERWELEGFLATGGMSDVYRARDRHTGEPGAAKVLRSELSHGSARFAAEVATLRQLRHPNVVRLVDAGEHGEVPYLVMELVPGPTLAERLRDEGTLGIEAAHRVGRDVAEALAYAHGLGVINRDVKPSNVLFDEDDVAKLADFGVAVLADGARLTDTGLVIGTASFIAPEQLSGESDIGPPADVYALGLTLLEAITGRPAFPGPSTEAALSRLSRDPDVPTDLPTNWRQLLQAMTAREPEARPPAAEVAETLAADLPEDRTRTLVLPVAAGQPTDAIPGTDEGAPPAGPGRGSRPRPSALWRSPPRCCGAPTQARTPPPTRRPPRNCQPSSRTPSKNSNGRCSRDRSPTPIHPGVGDDGVGTDRLWWPGDPRRGRHRARGTRVRGASGRVRR
jgi:serine/threonine protein kinase